MNQVQQVNVITIVMTCYVYRRSTAKLASVATGHYSSVKKVTGGRKSQHFLLSIFLSCDVLQQLLQVWPTHKHVLH